MTDELLLTLADMADISPKKVRLIINTYEKAKTGCKPIPEGFTSFKYKGRRYAYQFLGDGPWTLECPSVKLMRILRNYFISAGMMKVGGYWPGSCCNYAWTSDVSSHGNHVGLDSVGYTSDCYDGSYHARFAVLPQDSERKIINAYKKKATTGVKPVPEGYTAFEYEGRRYAYKSLGDGPWTPECASVELMKVLKSHFISAGMMEDGGYWPGSSYWAWTSAADSDGYHVFLDSDGGTNYDYDSDSCARFAVLPL